VGGLNGAPAPFVDTQVLEVQRARILAAMVEVVLEQGTANVSVAHVVSRAGVSRRTYYELFADREECFLAALDDAIAQIAAVVVGAFEGEGATQGARGARRAGGGQRAGAWHERVRAALVELLGLFDEDPGLARLAVVESLAGGPRALALRERALERVVGAVDEGRLAGGVGGEASALTAEGVVGAVSSILYTRLVAEDREPLLALTGPLMGMIVLPYLGKAAARRELARPAPPARTAVARSGAGYPFRELGMRLTYRTLRVLDAVARLGGREPGPSNRQVGEIAGIADQGQISKLLARLERLGLLENAIGAAGKGAPNAWRLTGKGQQITQTIRTQEGIPRDGGHPGGRTQRAQGRQALQDGGQAGARADDGGRGA
jgi:AcrR family transcriptional regulator/DNA-binding MarR family transcriptional regulator